MIIGMGGKPSPMIDDAKKVLDKSDKLMTKIEYLVDDCSPSIKYTLEVLPIVCWSIIGYLCLRAIMTLFNKKQQ